MNTLRAQAHLKRLQAGADGRAELTWQTKTAAFVGLLLGLTFLQPLAAQTCAPLPIGVVSWWPGEFDALDIYGTNDGVLMNGAMTSPGLVGDAFQFDGVDDYIFVPDDPSLDFATDAFTIELWFKSTAGGAVMIAKFDATLPLHTIRDDYVALVLNSSGTVEFRFVDIIVVSSNPLAVRYSATSTDAYDDGAWHHVAGVRVDSSTSKLYVDGVEVAGRTDIANVDLSTAGDILMGSFLYRPSTLLGQYDGLLDEVTVYDRALSAAEIQAIFLADVEGKCILDPTPTQLILEIIDFTVGLNLQNGIANSLDAKLDAAIDALLDLNDNNDAAACGSLNAFINAVQAQSGKKIDPGDAFILIAMAEDVLDALGCP